LPARRRLSKLIAKSIPADGRLEDGRGEVRMPYRSESPAASEGYPGGSSVASFKNGREFCIPGTDALTLTVVALK
jgi:hypothetical protein